MIKNPEHVTIRQPLPSPIRTQGDGMENEIEVKNEGKCLGDQLIYRAPDLKHFSPTPPVITGRIINLIPKTVTQGKEPKFIPYEPYKAAVKPIFPMRKKSMRRELKNLLVAAVGEDLQTRVHLLTEDKLQLARALLNSAQRLSTHQEQTEWLAGQCEVWRSKFLASSLMVEELARWKAALGQKATDLQEGLKRILEEHSKVRESLLNTYRNLCVLRENFDHTCSSNRKPDLASSNILDLAAGTSRLSANLRVTFLGSSNGQVRSEPDFTGLDMSTCAEKAAETLLSNPTPLLLSDAACSAVMGAAVAVGGQMLLRPSIPACCGHCSGEIKLV
ncbi:hypothetical protein L9F63_025418 [Diploptera punctata]|uniref:Golgin-45 n=1 Tax=Diploptera punctata TaxID=6984 RepID=A0AAD8E481_DIPPU|nr:hypothetical protein L9F63_025418 [Diploptera punctata]